MNLMVISFLINALNTLSRFQVSKSLADTECAQCHRSFTVAKEPWEFLLGTLHKIEVLSIQFAWGRNYF